MNGAGLKNGLRLAVALGRMVRLARTISDKLIQKFSTAGENQSQRQSFIHHEQFRE